MTARIAQRTLDVHDVERMLRFWSQALGRERDCDHLRPPADGEPGSPTVWLQWTDAPKPGKLRGHVDRYAEGDVEEEIARLERPGATRSDIGQTGDESFTVLVDPEGNEFCVLDRTWRSQEG